ncbi:MAG: signal peptidase I [Desulfosudaceae bacterium]
MTTTDPAVEAAKRKRSGFRENTEAVLVAVLLALLIRTFVVQAFKIPSGSMEPTLQVGDHILVNKFAYGVDIPFFKVPLIPRDHPERGDVVVFKYPEDPRKDFIKRVVGVGGDLVSVRNKQVYVNQSPVSEEYIMHTDSRMAAVRDNMSPVRVPSEKLFVMGDNRDNSHDSRFWGFVDEEEVLGSAFMIYWSWDGRAEGLLGHVRWGRIGDFIR